MKQQSDERRLTTILAADVVGYSRIMGEDEAGTLGALKAHRKELIEPKTAQYRGRTVKLMGDGSLMEFSSVVDAVHFAVEVQIAMRQRNSGVTEDRQMIFRIGINIGDIIVEGDDIYGDGVNVAARLEGLAEPGGICVARNVFNQVKGKLELNFEHLGDKEVKNITEPVSVYQVIMDETAGRLVTAVRPSASRRGLRPALMVAGIALLAVIGVLAWWRPWTPTVEPASIERMAFPLPDKPSIAVLPFTNMSGDSEQEYFVDGMTVDLITDLSKISGLFVIARNSIFTYKGQPVQVRQVAEELGVRYVLEGSVRRAGEQVRINAQLIDATTGGHLWAERYDGALTDIFALQDQVTRQIVSALAITLTPDEQQGLSRATKVDSKAYDLLLQAQAQVMRLSQEPNAEARDLYERAVALDASFARAHAGLAWSHTIDIMFGWTKHVDDAEQKALRHARTALALDPTDPQVHFALSQIHSTQRRIPDALEEIRRAIALDPNYADAYAAKGLYLAFSGEPEQGLKAIRKAMRLSPRPGFAYVWVLSNVYFAMGRYDDAIVTLEDVLRRNPASSGGRLLLIAIYGLLDRIDDAQWEVEEILAAHPDFSIAEEKKRSRFQKLEDLERYIMGLRKAGLPE